MNNHISSESDALSIALDNLLDELILVGQAMEDAEAREMEEPERWDAMS